MDVPQDTPDQVIPDIESFIRAAARVRQTPDELWMFRGHADASWPLHPKIDRLDCLRYRTAEHISRLDHEKRLLWHFKKWGAPHLVRGLDEWELIAIAQHHGLVTRLLDWTANPLTGLFFAVEDDRETDFAVWMFKQLPDEASWVSFPKGPLSANKLVSFDPPHVTSRIPSQAAKFTAHPPDMDANESPWPGALVKLVFKSKDRLLFRNRLRNLGVSHATLFPDLDGITATLNTTYSRTK